MTQQGPGDGTLSLLPVAKSISYFLLRALQKDVAEDDLCGATPGRALGASQEWHKEILEGLISIPEVEPGATVWWHPNVIHSVANELNKLRQIYRWIIIQTCVLIQFINHLSIKFFALNSNKFLENLWGSEKAIKAYSLARFISIFFVEIDCFKIECSEII